MLHEKVSGHKEYTIFFLTLNQSMYERKKDKKLEKTTLAFARDGGVIDVHLCAGRE